MATTPRYMQNTVLALGIAGALAFAGQTQAAGFQLKENSVKSMGSAFAGTAAKTGELSLPGAFERDRLLGLELVEGALDGAWGMITPAGAPLLPKRPLLKTKASRSRKAPLAVPHAA